LYRGTAIVESFAGSRLIPKQLMGVGKIKFEHLRKTKDLAGTSRETKTGTPHS
jgi:hypothetical protein